MRRPLDHFRFCRKRSPLFSLTAIPAIAGPRGRRISAGPLCGLSCFRQKRKRSGDIDGTLVLMVYCIERGHEFTSSCSDVDQPFYNSLNSVYDFVLKHLQKFAEYKHTYHDRLAVLARDFSNFGWSYDELYHLYCDAFPGD